MIFLGYVLNILPFPIDFVAGFLYMFGYWCSTSFLCILIFVVTLNLVSPMYTFSHSLHFILYTTPSSSFFTISLLFWYLYFVFFFPVFCLLFYCLYISNPLLMYLHTRVTISPLPFLFFFLIHIFFLRFSLFPSFHSVSRRIMKTVMKMMWIRKKERKGWYCKVSWVHQRMTQKEYLKRKY